MARYFLHRFLLIHIVPGDPVEQMLGESAAPGQAAELRHTLGLDRPLIVQYGKYLWQVARGDFGQSFKFQAAVRRVIFERYPATLQLALLAFNLLGDAWRDWLDPRTRSQMAAVEQSR
ncbi:MAG TPA: hypothetical protein VKA02_11320 [Candidatus Acidoferrum sp.]|nr:hypothetical protein [Candidatus Acidoferrum sp.]